ncbi:hypothetical protein BDN67DRAFT_972136 [Paxillus ammoniavirescens]|nr:hypothetical protein BDN67DRAFT_972136 [Paxillus ammoniavirescens]
MAHPDDAIQSDSHLLTREQVCHLSVNHRWGDLDALMVKDASEWSQGVNGVVVENANDPHHPPWPGNATHQ